jgi:vacuolar iron transporter family protein
VVESPAPTPGSTTAATHDEGDHVPLRRVGGNALRAAVLGANDGLVSNLALVMGVAGADLSGQAILITGIAGLLAGAGSMALGEWVSVQSSRELFKRQLEIEAKEIRDSPDSETEELVHIYQAKGLGDTEARLVAERIMQDQDLALRTMAAEELGIDPDDLGGSAWVAAGTSFALFAVGAVVPVLPFIFLSVRPGIAVSLVLSGIGLVGLGAAISWFTGRGAVRSGIRQLVLGLAAAGLTFLVGRILGVTLAS